MTSKSHKPYMPQSREEENVILKAVVASALSILWLIVSFAIWLEVASSIQRQSDTAIMGAALLTIAFGSAAVIVYLLFFKLRDKANSHQHLEAEKSWRLTKVTYYIVYALITIFALFLSNTSPLPIIIALIMFYPLLIIVRKTYMYINGNSEDTPPHTYSDKEGLMSEEGKQDIANRFYADERCRSIADVYAQRMDNEAKELLNLDTSLFTDKNPQMQALTTKALIGDHVEKIFQAAYHDKKLKDDEWRQAMGFAKGAAALIAQARTKEQKAFVVALAQFMLVNDYDVPIQQANFLLAGFLGEVKKG